jgi:hypothetical protein
MTNITLKPNNKPTKPGFYLVTRPIHKDKINNIVSARVIQSKYYNGGSLYLFLGEISCFPLSKMEEDCLWSDEIIIDIRENGVV